MIDTVIAPAVMAAWGGRVAGRLIQHLGACAEADPELAERLALSVWEFEDQRDEDNFDRQLEDPRAHEHPQARP